MLGPRFPPPSRVTQPRSDMLVTASPLQGSGAVLSATLLSNIDKAVETLKRTSFYHSSTIGRLEVRVSAAGVLLRLHLAIHPVRPRTGWVGFADRCDSACSDWSPS